MATFDGNDLKKLRISKGLSVLDLADMVGEDENLIRRYENNSNKTPHPDTMYQLCLALGDSRNWKTWMRTEFKSYAREHPEPVPYGLEGAILKLFSELQDLEDLQHRVMADGADGEIDSVNLRQNFLTELEEMIQAAESAKSILERRIRDGA